MNAITTREMRSLEEAAIREGWTEERLMGLAGEQLAHSIARFFPTPGTIVAYLGKGHNAGDAFVALRVLRDQYRWRIAIRPAYSEETWAPLTRVKSFELGNVPAFQPDKPGQSAGPLVLLDSLIGIGANGPLRHPLLDSAREMNHLRETIGARIAAIDLPSGTDPDTGEIHPGSVITDVTFMIAAAKRGLLLERAANATGALAIVPVEGLEAGKSGDFKMISPGSIAAVHQPRPHNFHKGTAGRVGILAGSKDYSGAAVLAATSALRAGAGLVTLHTPQDSTDFIAAKCPPEVIVRPCRNPVELLELRYDSLVVGCGLHSPDETYRAAVLELLARTGLPTVIDAEALNLIAASGDLSILRENHILTPHPGEFSRLSSAAENESREQGARSFADRTPSVLLLKGCRTVVSKNGAPLWFNPTGNPGMATGGQGDLLSGVIGALLAIGNPPLEAACISAWICGRAAERSLLDPNQSPESLLPSDVLNHLGGAFNDWRTRQR